MKFTLSWLKQHLDTAATVDEITYALTDLGLEVEGIEDRGAKLADFTIGHVISAEKHPDADRLRVCQVETDEGGKQIICGAPNAREGITVVVAKPGVYVPGIDTTIGVGKIRGVESHGRLCAAKELEAGEDHDGIADLDDKWDLGSPAAEALGATDPVIDFEVTPNRPDAICLMGELGLSPFSRG